MIVPCGPIDIEQVRPYIHQDTPYNHRVGLLSRSYCHVGL